MTTLALELVDSGIQLAVDGNDGARELGRYPGFACIERGQIVTGLGARAEWRRQPRSVHHRFWERLDTAHLEPPFPRSLTHADLVHSQLASLWDEWGQGIDEAVFAVPGTLGVEQLGLLLGIARACGIPVRGLIDGAVAIAARLSGTRMLCLDLHLHRAVLTEVDLRSGVERGGIAVQEACGLIEAEEVIARRIAQIFLRGTRFDPLHGAASEQILFDCLPGWMLSWGEGEAVLVQLPKGSREVALEVAAGEILGALEPLADRLAALVGRRSNAETLLAVTPRAAAIPGLARRLEEVSKSGMTILAPGAAAQAALALHASIRCEGAEVEHVIRLAGSKAVSPEAADRRASSGHPTPQPLYLLLGHVAHAIGSEPLEVGTTGGAVSIVRRGEAEVTRCCSLRWDGVSVELEALDGPTIELNGHRITGPSPVRSGDRIRIAGHDAELLLICLDEHGTA